MKVNLLIDWPTGTRNLGKSLITNAYLVFAVFLNFDLKNVILSMIGVGNPLVVIAFTAFFVSVTGEKTTENIAQAVTFALLVSLTALQFANLARFGYPFYWGLYYGFAAAFRISAIAFLLKDKPWLTATSLSLSVMTHPIVGGIGAIVVGTVLLSRGVSATKRYLIPAITACPDNCSLALSTIRQFGHFIWEHSGRRLFKLTEIFNRHWYPINFGVFEPGLSKYHLIPLISLSILYCCLQMIVNAASKVDRELRLIIIALGMMTAFGVVFE